MALSILLNMATKVIVAASDQPKSVACLSIIADLEKVPDGYLIIGAEEKHIKRSLTFEEGLALYVNTTGDEIKKALPETVLYQVSRIFKGTKVNPKTLEELKKELGKPFKTSKLPIPEGRGSSLPSGIKRPKDGTVTGKVWKICDRVYTVNNRIPNKEAIVLLCEKEGINSSTAATQFSKWKGSK
jgi:hypothetical protein